jgi:hypothetical protein
MRASLSVVILVALSSHSGCSYLFVSGPPANHVVSPYFDCTDTNALPGLDLIWAALNGVGAVLALSDSDKMIDNRDQVIAVGSLWAVVSGTSAIYGFSKVAACKQAKLQRDQRFAPGMVPGYYPPPAYPPGYYPPPPGYPPPAGYPAPGAAPPAGAAPSPGATAPDSTPRQPQAAPAQALPTSAPAPPAAPPPGG